MDKPKAPSTIGEWDLEIAKLSRRDLERYREALKTLQSWESCNEAFKWTRVFILIQSIEFEMDRQWKKAPQ